MLLRSSSVRHEFPLRAMYSRRVLPHVVGFPHLRVLFSIRLPIRIRRTFPFTVLLRLPGKLSTPTLRFQHSSVSGFPLLCLNSRIPYSDASHSQEPMGSPKFFDVSLPACHSLWTPADPPILTLPDALVLPSVYVKTLGVRNNLISKLYQHFRVRGHPCGLQDSLCTLRPAIVHGLPRSALDATLDTGGWLSLTRPGLSPGKIRQASWRDNARGQRWL